MEKLNSNIFKKFILGLASVFCSCALYVSVANAKLADEYTNVTSLAEQAEIQNNFVSQKYIATTTTKELASNIADYTTIEEKPAKKNKVKDFFTTNKAKNTTFALIGASAFLTAVLGISFGGKKLHNKYKESKKNKYTPGIVCNFTHPNNFSITSKKR